MIGANILSFDAVRYWIDEGEDLEAITLNDLQKHLQIQIRVI